MKSLCCITILIFFISCQNKNIDKETCQINVETVLAKNLLLSEFISDINYLPLESTNSIFIGNIKKVIFNSDNIFILDSEVNKILIFSNTGKFINQIIQTGRGPGECMHIVDFIFDSSNKTIEVLDDGNRKVAKFDLSGNLQNEISLPLSSIVNFDKFNDNLYIFNTCNSPNNNFFESEQYNLVLLDSNSNLVSRFLPIKDLRYLRRQSSNGFNKYENGINVIIPFDNNIYHVTPEKCFSTYKINFENFNIPDELFEEYNISLEEEDPKVRSLAMRKFMQQINENGYSTGVETFFENSNLIFFRYNLPRKGSFCGFYNKQDQTTIVGIPFNDIDYGIFGDPIGLIKDTLYTVIQPIDLISKIEKNKVNKSINKNQDFIKLYEFSNSIKENDNPVILKFLLKTNS